MFKKLKAKMGAGAASVDAVLSNPTVRPGDAVTGIVHVEGGDVEQEINRITVALETVVEVETDDSEFNSTQRFATQPITGGMTVRPGRAQQFPFSLQVPWETPLTHIERPRAAAACGWACGPSSRSRARSTRATWTRSRSSRCPARQQLIEALAQLGFRFKSADVEKGRLQGREAPVLPGDRVHPGPEYRGKFNELEVTFLGGPQETRVIFEADTKGGWFSEGKDADSWFTIPTDGGGDFVGLVQHQLHALGQRRGWSSFSGPDRRRVQPPVPRAACVAMRVARGSGVAAVQRRVRGSSASGTCSRRAGWSSMNGPARRCRRSSTRSVVSSRTRARAARSASFAVSCREQEIRRRPTRRTIQRPVRSGSTWTVGAEVAMCVRWWLNAAGSFERRGPAR